MFEVSREKVVAAIVEALQPVLRVSAMHGGLPVQYWNDAFVLGFMQGAAGAIALRVTKKKDIDKDHVVAMLLAYHELSGGQGKAIGQRARDFSDAANIDFQRGMGNAIMCVNVAYGDDGYDDEPIVIKAKRVSSDLTVVLGHINRKHPERTRTAGALLFMMFHDIVRERLRT